MPAVKVALVHDYLVEAGGAERVLATLHELYPDAPIYTSVYDPATALPSLRGADIVTSFLQKLPHSRRRYKWLLPLYPFAFEQFDLAGFDVVISNTTSFAKGVLTHPGTTHISYCHTPSRFAWRTHDYLRRERAGRLRRVILSFLLHQQRTWDFVAAQRVDHFLANSHNTAARIRKFYGRGAEVLPCPVDTTFYCPAETGDGTLPDGLFPREPFFLVVSRLAAYKRVDLAVRACTALGASLVVVGSGTARAELERLAGPTVRFAGQVSDAELREYYRRCAAVIFPGEEDFGLVPIEANACGRPVVAYRAGGALETVVEGVTGEFFDHQSADALAGVLERFRAGRYDAGVIRRHALRYDTRVFKAAILEYVHARVYADKNGTSLDVPAMPAMPASPTPQPVAKSM